MSLSVFMLYNGLALIVFNLIPRSFLIVGVFFKDYPGLKNPLLIEELRQNFLNAFRAYTTG